ERPARRDGDRGPAADDPGPGRSVHRASAAPARGEARHHRLGPGERAGVAALERADRSRRVVRGPPLAAARPEDPGADGPDAPHRRRPLQGGHGRMAADRVAVLLTGGGKRYDVVSAFARHAFTIAVDPNPLAPAQYAADVRAAPPPIGADEYVPFLLELVRENEVRAVVPLTDLDIEDIERLDVPARVPPPAVARA